MPGPGQVRAGSRPWRGLSLGAPVTSEPVKKGFCSGQVWVGEDREFLGPGWVGP